MVDAYEREQQALHNQQKRERLELAEAKAKIARLRAALKPFAEVFRGERLNAGPVDWQQASEVYTNTVQ
jgi:hypothetical protein